MLKSVVKKHFRRTHDIVIEKTYNIVYITIITITIYERARIE